MRIAVIADTHDKLPDELTGLLSGADEIWHLGDVCSPMGLVEVEQLGKPVHVVLGNNDAYPGWPQALKLSRAGQTFFLTHIAPPVAPAGVQVVLHGHTHVPRDETDVAGVRWLNPGSLSLPRGGCRPSFAWLTVKEGAGFDWRLRQL